MAVTVACVAGEEIHRQWSAGHIRGQAVGARQTPFGPSEAIFLVEDDDAPFYLLPRYGVGMGRPAPHRINARANLYALKDLGVRCVLAWAPGGTITHNFAVGDLVIVSDVIDRTCLRSKTFFEDSPLGFLRQFPVFCPSLRRVIGEVLYDMKLVYHGAGIAAVSEGPRLETPAEVSMLARVGAEVATHAFVPEVFLARELQLCYAAICYVVNYAETGSGRRPFAAGELFGGLTQQSDAERLAAAVGAMSRIARSVVAAVDDKGLNCDCEQTMADHARKYDLPDDWREWFS